MESSLSARRKYYADRSIQFRISDFLGGSQPAQATAIYFAAGTEQAPHHRERVPLEDLQSWMRRPCLSRRRHPLGRAEAKPAFAIGPCERQQRLL
jgi:hypothetical protein